MVPEGMERRWGLPPGAADSWFESFAPLQFASYPLLDETGRALGEGNVEPALRPAFRESPCPYEDDREGRPMNATALQLVNQDWPWILATVSALAQARDGGGTADLLSLWSFSASIGAFPMGMARAGLAPGGVPRRVASLFKVIQGVFMTAWAELPGGSADVDALREGIARRRLLHGRSGRVCGGSPAKIEDLLTACLGGPSPPGGSSIAVDLPLDVLLPYGRAYAALTLEKWGLGARDARAVAALRASGQTVEADVPVVDDALALAIDARLGAPHWATTLEGWIAAQDAATARMTALQVAACDAVGALPPAEPFRRSMIPGQRDLARWVAERA